METIVTIVAVIGAVSFGVLIFKLATHPTNGKIHMYYKDRYRDHWRTNFPPF